MQIGELHEPDRSIPGGRSVNHVFGHLQPVRLDQPGVARGDGDACESDNEYPEIGDALSFKTSTLNGDRLIW